MKTRVDDNSEAPKANIPAGSPVEDKATSPWYQTAVRTAIVGGVFSLIVFGLLVLNYIQRTVFDAERVKELDALKIEILDEPDNEQLILRIRQLDLRVRRDKIRRPDFSYKGSFVLLGSLAVLLIGLKWSATFKKKPPAPEARLDTQDQQLREAMWARWSVTAGLVLLGSGTLFFAMRGEIDFSAASMESISYPSTEEISRNWPRFRGPGGLGISAYTNVPSKWNGKTGEGIVWKSEVPLPGHNSPVVWGERVFISGADENKRQVYCFDALSGKPLWEGDVMNAIGSSREPIEVGDDTGFAAPTVVTDGRRVCAIFASGDIGCFDFKGKKVWEKSLGTPESSYGYVSSLEMYRNLLLIQYDQGMVEDEKSKLIALDSFSGRTAWAMKRPVPNSWTSPIVAKIGDQHQVITCGDPWVIAYEPSNGAELWRAECSGTDVAPSPIYAGGLVFAIEPYAKLAAIRPDGRGDVTKTHIAWSAEEDAPDICSPVSNGELIFLLTTAGTLTCYQVKDGTKLWEQDLKGNFNASPSLVGERLYLLSEKGVMFIIEAGSQYRELTRCELGEDCHASPAFANGRIYIRGVKNLYCVGNKE